MRTWRLTLEYEGTKYRGWQEQANARTVQGVLRQAVEDYFGQPVDLQGAGRTDAGVHALAQVAHVKAKGPPRGSGRRFDPKAIRHGLNDRLPADVVVLSVESAAAAFHARHDARSRGYCYRISTRPTAFFKKHVWWVKEDLNVERMSRTADLLPGRHDFTCFRAKDPARPDESPIVVVESASVSRKGELIVFRIEASHFLWKMVRRLTGTLVKVGTDELTAGDFQRLLDGRCDPRHDVAGWTAPASGLFLEKVRY